MSEPALFGLDLFGNARKPPSTGPVAERFTFPPFSVLDARSGEWQDRKRAWSSLFQSEEGRGFNALRGGITGCYVWTSMFDPVLAELAYRWFSPPGGRVLDPFAGGSVRGIVAGCLGRSYVGIDVRPEQVEENRRQAAEADPVVPPEWRIGDSRWALPDAPMSDFLFSCPPYGDLERYSDDPADVSTFDYPEFIAAYRFIIARAVARLRDDSFAAFVVGDFRDKAGHYRGFVADTVAAFEDAGARFYNDGILLMSINSASMRVSRQFAAGRKFAKVHQNLLVFVKGDWRKAADRCGAL